MTDVSEFIPEDKKRKKNLNKILDILERNGIDLDDVGKVQRINLYQGFYKDDEGEAHVVDMSGISFSPSWEDGPEWPVVQPSKPTVVKPAAIKKSRPDDGYKRAVLLPDMQIGYYFDRFNVMHPTHDEEAINVALQLVQEIQPDVVVMHGDNLDFPELGKYRLTPAFARTTQATIDRGGLMVAQVRAVAPNAQIVWLEGNHELRLSNYLLDNAAAAFGIKRANVPDDWPVMSVPHLCRLDEYNVVYASGYPANEFWLNDNFRVIHGTNVVSNGSTAHKYLASERVSVAYGHIHRREWAERTVRNAGGSKTITALSAGCLARVDGSVPSTKGGMDLNGVPVPVVEDWQQGIAVITYEEGDGHFWPEQVVINNGQALYHGKFFSANLD